VRFVEGDIHDPAPDGPFDAIVGRLVKVCGGVPMVTGCRSRRCSSAANLI
jgi:hypothetical protein